MIKFLSHIDCSTFAIFGSGYQFYTAVHVPTVNYLQYFVSLVWHGVIYLVLSTVQPSILCISGSVIFDNPWYIVSLIYHGVLHHINSWNNSLTSYFTVVFSLANIPRYRLLLCFSTPLNLFISISIFDFGIISFIIITVSLSMTLHHVELSHFFSQILFIYLEIHAYCISISLPSSRRVCISTSRWFIILLFTYKTYIVNNWYSRY